MRRFLKHRRASLLVGGLAIGLMHSSTAAMAGPLEDGKNAWASGDYELAARLLPPLAEQGDPSAQHVLGRMYEGGEGVPQDYIEAVKWFRKSAEQGYAPAQFFLGLMYAKGKGVPQDHAEAARWYLAAAEQGRDPHKFDLAYANAQHQLGLAYANGLGVRKDLIEAYKWLNLATTTVPKAFREGMAKDRDRVLGKLSASDIAEGQRRVREWIQQRR